MIEFIHFFGHLLTTQMMLHFYVIDSIDKHENIDIR